MRGFVRPQPCPTQTVGGNSWGFYNGSSGARIGCYINGNQAAPTTQAITNLAKLYMAGASSSGQQRAVLQDSDGTVWS